MGVRGREWERAVEGGQNILSCTVCNHSVLIVRVCRGGMVTERRPLLNTLRSFLCVSVIAVSRRHYGGTEQPKHAEREGFPILGDEDDLRHHPHHPHLG